MLQRFWRAQKSLSLIRVSNSDAGVAWKFKLLSDPHFYGSPDVVTTNYSSSKNKLKILSDRLPGKK